MFTHQRLKLCEIIKNLKKLNFYRENVRTLQICCSTSSTLRIPVHNQHQSHNQYQQIRWKKDDTNLSALFKPVPVKSNPDDISVGFELTGKLDKGELLKVLNKFTQKRETKMLCMENGLDSK